MTIFNCQFILRDWVIVFLYYIYIYFFCLFTLQDVEKALVYPTVPDLRRKVPETSYHYLLERRRNIMQLKERADELAVSTEQL